MQGRKQGECFSVLGFDVMLDTKLRPWLLEINVEPSFYATSPYDKHVKTILVSDTMHLVGFQDFDVKKIKKELLDKKRGLDGKEKKPKPIKSFLKGIPQLSHEYIDMLARYEEEEHRSQQTFYDLIFPTVEGVHALGNSFDHISFRNQVLWEYINEDRPIKKLQDYFAKCKI